jgi:glycosyltransferase involved in cell wall biosynthesis
MFRLNMPINYGSFANATSLNLITKKLYFELAEMMNNTKSFTITATLLNDCNIGDVNQHYDCVSVPNMGGYRFPLNSSLNSENLVVGLVGIDEVVLGREVYKTENDWLNNKPIIEQELKKWKSDIDKVRFVHVSNQPEKDQLIEYLKIPEEKISIIPYGVDHNLFKPISEKSSSRNKILKKFSIRDTPYLIHISERNWARKNVFRLFEAFKKAKSNGIPHKLLIVGKNDDIVYKKAKSIPDTHMMGFVSESDLITLLQCADALINPSLHEGFGLPMLEAMACGTPVITCNVYSPPAVVRDGGLFVDPRNTDDICEKILDITKNENLRLDLGKNGLKRSNDFSWKNTATQLLKLCKSCSIPNDYDFNDHYDKSAKRTLVTICLSNADLKKKFLHSIIQLNFSDMIEWALNFGLNDPQTSDFLKPLEKWMQENQKTDIQTIKN